jgi:hypothetical protein
MRPLATSVWGLKLLVYEALSGGARAHAPRLFQGKKLSGTKNWEGHVQVLLVFVQHTCIPFVITHNQTHTHTHTHTLTHTYRHIQRERERERERETWVFHIQSNEINRGFIQIYATTSKREVFTDTDTDTHRSYLRCVLKGQIFEMCIKKTASKEKRNGFSFASEAVLKTCKLAH